MAPSPARVPVRQVGFESRDLTEVQDLIGRRYVAVRPHLLDDGRGFVFRPASASAGELSVDSLTFWTRMEFDTDPFVRVTVMSLFDGRYAVGAIGRDLRRVARGESVLFAPGSQITAVIDRITYHLLQFPAAALTPVADRLGVGSADLRFDATAPVSQAMNRYWRATAAYLSRSFTGPDPAIAHPLILAGVVEAAAAAVLAVFPNTTMTLDYVAGPGRAAPAAVRRAVAYIDAHADEPITVTDVAAAAGIGVRGLQAAFARHRDITPSGYLRRVRLERAHRELQAGDRPRRPGDQATCRRGS
ncbi:helix-turn-helix domain-containing protein [Planobispora siamensis]|uniref:HTH araC/xylS-type domain-containing protein n=1 Tax=Planobispora siamensis TaxID=936338 RepID=A0A8J3SKE3_9ACTN|nr:helix-turn-helix domain-containing protein [Planobispora siamensis]GIH96023.1 hypothetical protein Psi01_66530 [Planobispora siamensis]